MSNAFFAAFNPSLGEAERIMGEEWTFDGVTRQAIAIDALEMSKAVNVGGKLETVNTTITVALAVFTESAVQVGSVVTARGQRVRVMNVVNDGDDARTLECGPEGFATPTRR